MISNFDDFNYLEVNLVNSYFNKNIKNKENKENQVNKENSHLNIIDINWDDKSFNSMLMKFINDYGLKPFEKKFRILKHNDKNLIYSINDNKFSVNRQRFLSYNKNANYILIKYQKENIPPVNFPSTNIIHDMYYINKIIFKVSNRIYINFEVKKKIKEGNSEIFRRIYINLNNDKKNLDNSSINEKLEETIKYFK
jgi:hypothetical protein|tara:strand:+ start:59 stop:646 length:588 start_codon:yes stop_codon:yes gene_type:complete